MPKLFEQDQYQDWQESNYDPQARDRQSIEETDDNPEITYAHIMLLAIVQSDGKWAISIMNRCIQNGINTDVVMANVADLMSAGDHEIPEQPDWYDLD